MCSARTLPVGSRNLKPLICASWRTSARVSRVDETEICYFTPYPRLFLNFQCASTACVCEHEISLQHSTPSYMVVHTHRDTAAASVRLKLRPCRPCTLHTPELTRTLKRAGVHRVRPIPRGLIGRVVNVVVTATTRVVGLGPPAGQRRLAWLGVGLKLGLGWG